MGACPHCDMPVEHLEFFSQTGKFNLSGTVRKDGEAVINFGGDSKKREPGFYCPVCGELLTEDVQTARRILSAQNPSSSA
jgi:hypothetical protein